MELTAVAIAVTITITIPVAVAVADADAVAVAVAVTVAVAVAVVVAVAIKRVSRDDRTMPRHRHPHHCHHCRRVSELGTADDPEAPLSAPLPPPLLLRERVRDSQQC